MVGFWYSAVHVKSEQSHRVKASLGSRDQLVRAKGNVNEMIIQGIFPWCFTPFCKGNDAQRASRVAIRGRV
jgi:hypothetical protein